MTVCPVCMNGRDPQCAWHGDVAMKAEMTAATTPATDAQVDYWLSQCGDGDDSWGDGVILSLIARIHQDREKAGWQPIETATKEMEPLFLWHEQWIHPVMGRWSDARNGWIEYGSRDIKANIATHWQPLPTPPALSQEERT